MTPSALLNRTAKPAPFEEGFAKERDVATAQREAFYQTTLSAVRFAECTLAASAPANLRKTTVVSPHEMKDWTR
jgi:hypothetical protein